MCSFYSVLREVVSIVNGCKPLQQPIWLMQMLWSCSHMLAHNSQRLFEYWYIPIDLEAAIESYFGMVNIHTREFNI